MEELTRYGRCIERLREASSNPSACSGGPLSFQEFLKDVQKLRRSVTLLTTEANKRLTEARTTRDRFKEELPAALSLVAPQQLNEFRNLFQDVSRPHFSVKTKPLLCEQKQLNGDTISLTKNLLNQKVVSMTPTLASNKKRSFSALKRKFAQNPSTTPQMPNIKRRQNAGSEDKFANKTLADSSVVALPLSDRQTANDRGIPRTDSGTPSIPVNQTHDADTIKPERTAKNFISMKQPDADSAGSVRHEPSTEQTQCNTEERTPKMKNRIVFFDNPNVTNIHQRYVAIQDSEELTCLLPKWSQSNHNITPEQPKTRKTIVQTTPPVPLTFNPTPKKTVTPDRPIVRITPGSLVSSGKRSKGRKTIRMSKTPSPPRFVRRTTRICLGTKLNDLPSEQDYKDGAAFPIEQDSYQKETTEGITPQAPSKRVTLKPSIISHTKISNGSEVSISGEVTVGPNDFNGVCVNKPLSVLVDKTPELKHFLKRTLAEPPFRKVAKEGQPRKFGSLEDQKEIQSKQDSKTIQDTQHDLAQKQGQSSSAEDAKTTIKTPVKPVTTGRTLLKASAKSTLSQVPSVSLSSDGKLHAIRPSKMA